MIRMIAAGKGVRCGNRSDTSSEPRSRSDHEPNGSSSTPPANGCSPGYFYCPRVRNPHGSANGLPLTRKLNFACHLLTLFADVRKRVVKKHRGSTPLNRLHTHIDVHNRDLYRSQQYLTSTSCSLLPLTTLRNIPISHFVRSGPSTLCLQTPAQAHKRRSRPW